MLDLLKRLWRGWKALAHALVEGQSWLLMAIAYVLVIGPVALWIKMLRRDPLDRDIPDPKAPTLWKPLKAERQDVRRAQRPW